MKPVRQHKSLAHHPSVYRCRSKTDQKCHYLNRLTSHMGYVDVIFANWFRKAAKKSKVEASTAKRHLVLRCLQHLQLWGLCPRSNAELNQLLDGSAWYVPAQRIDVV